MGGVGQKEGVSGVGRVGLRCFVKKVLLKVSQNLQERTCTGISCFMKEDSSSGVFL